MKTSKVIPLGQAGQIVHGVNHTEAISVDFASLAPDFLAALDVRSNSKRTYERALNRFFAWIITEDITAPERTDVMQYRDALLDSGMSSLTVASYLTAVKRFFVWLELEGVCENIATGVKAPKAPQSYRKDPLTDDQVKDLLESVNTEPPQGKRDYAVLNLMLRTGVRTIEVARANIEDIRQHGGQAVLYVHGKGRDGKDEFVVLTREALRPIHSYLKTRGPVRDGDPLFSSCSDRNNGARLSTRSIRRVVKKHLRDIDLDSTRLSAHSLRHTFATNALNNDAPVVQVKDALRHANLETTMRYIRNLNRVSNAAENFVSY